MAGDEKTSKDEIASLSGRGSPAYMSPKEPGIKLLREKYAESFAITMGTNNRIHLFLVKLGLWALVYTFLPKDFKEGSLSPHSGQLTLEVALRLLEETLTGSHPEIQQKLDKAVVDALTRIEKKTKQFRTKTR